jgi:hypothetical protein
MTHEEPFTIGAFEPTLPRMSRLHPEQVAEKTMNRSLLLSQIDIYNAFT